MKSYSTFVMCMLISFVSTAGEPIPSEPVRANALNKYFPHVSLRKFDDNRNLEIGGALRGTYRNEHWDATELNGRFIFESFRLDIQANYDRFYGDLGYWFQDDGKKSIDRGFIGYRLNANSNFQFGAPLKPFNIEPYPQFGASWHIPFFMGYGVSAGSGIKYVYNSEYWGFQFGYFPRMLRTDIRFSPEIGRYSDLKYNAIAVTQSRQNNEKRNQINGRAVRHFNLGDWKSEVGTSLAVAQLYNTTTTDNGSYWAGGIHTILNKDAWTLTFQGIRFEYDPKNPDGVSEDSVLMGGNGLTPAYLIAAKASIVSLNVSYDISPELGSLKKVKIYNDYSRMFKDRQGWSDSQMYTVGVQLLAMPIMAWADVTMAQNANPYGGVENGSGFTDTVSMGSNKWYYRTNINVGYYF